MKEYPRVEVTWVDAKVGGGWQQPETLVKEAGLALCHSVGYLVRNDAEMVVLTQSQSDVPNMADWLAIPTGCVRQVKRLR